MRVRVLGTTFNFKSDKNCRVAEATLIEGEIEVKGNKEEGQIILAPGQRAELNKKSGRLTVKQVDAKLARQPDSIPKGRYLYHYESTGTFL